MRVREPTELERFLAALTTELGRAGTMDLAGTPVPFAAAEDLIIHKLFAARPRDLEDVRGVVLRKGDALDWAYMEKWAGDFAGVPGREGMPAMLAELKCSLPQK